MRIEAYYIESLFTEIRSANQATTRTLISYINSSDSVTRKKRVLLSKGSVIFGV